MIGQRMRKNSKRGKIRDEERERDKSTVNNALRCSNKTFEKSIATQLVVGLSNSFLLQNVTINVNKSFYIH